MAESERRYDPTAREMTFRALLTGVLLGAVLSISNLYIGFKAGWSLGVTITAAIMAFAVFKTLRTVVPGLVRTDLGILENNIVQTTASASGFISSAGLVSAVPALMMISGRTIPIWQLMIWMVTICLLGLAVAIPIKRQLIDVEELRFPTGFATAEVLKSVHAEGSAGTDAVRKARTLFACLGLGAVLAWIRDGVIGIPVMRGWRVVRESGIWKWHRIEWTLPSVFTFPGAVTLFGFPLGRLTLGMEGSLIMAGAGAIVGIRIGLSLLLGAVLGYGILAPVLIHRGQIRHAAPALHAEDAPEAPFPIAIPAGTVIGFEAGQRSGPGGDLRLRRFDFRWAVGREYADDAALADDLNAPALPGGGPNPLAGAIAFSVERGRLVAQAPDLVQWDARLTVLPGDGAARLGFAPGASSLVRCGGYRSIVSWLMWPGVSMMVMAGLLSFALRWRTVWRAFAGIWRGLAGRGPPSGSEREGREVPGSWFVSGFLLAGTAAVLLQGAFFGITVWMGALAVVMSFFLAVVACRALGETDINPVGPMGKITQLFYGAVDPGNVTTNLLTANVTAGAATASADLLQALKCGRLVQADPRRQFWAQVLGVLTGSLVCVPVYVIMVPDADVLGTEELPAPSAQVWAGVARLLSRGFRAMPDSARWALLTGALLGVALTLIENRLPKAKRFLPSATGIGIALVIPAFTSISMFLGALAAWIAARLRPSAAERYTVPVASGFIAGESLMGTFIAIARNALKWIP